jgi:hypothetical protein
MSVAIFATGESGVPESAKIEVAGVMELLPSLSG